MTKLNSLTLGGNTYDSFPDQEAREAIQELTKTIPTDVHINELINTALGVIENGSY